MDDSTGYIPSADDRTLEINHRLAIPRSELSFRTSRSSGPGGQHVNKVETRVELLFDVAHTLSLSDEDRQCLLSALKPWLDGQGTLHLFADRSRSQYINREEAITRFVAILRETLRPRKRRKATHIPRAMREARLQQKKMRGERKRLRGRASHADD